LKDLSRYLKAMARRAERLQNDPRKDQARMLVVRDFEAQLDRLVPKLARDRHEELRFLLEELRVQLFAQELGTREPVSEKRVQKLLEQAEGRADREFLSRFVGARSIGRRRIALPASVSECRWAAS
jgi:ATP-dependent helicase HrpA